MVSRELNIFRIASETGSYGCHCSANLKRVRVLPYRIFVFRELRSLDDFRTTTSKSAASKSEKIQRFVFTTSREGDELADKVIVSDRD